MGTIDDNEARAMKDRHSRDEAEMRELQQQSAGQDYSPVEAYPQHGAQAGAWGPSAQALVDEYERALHHELSRWQVVKNCSHDLEFAAAFQDWRAAVEERDKATRLLINRSLPPTGT